MKTICEDCGRDCDLYPVNAEEYCPCGCPSGEMDTDICPWCGQIQLTAFICWECMNGGRVDPFIS